MEPVTIAAVQAAPVFCDRDATIEKVASLTKEAAGHDARLIAFSEGFVPTYPDWVWRTTPWADREWYARWFDQAVDVPGPASDALGAIAREHECYLAIPVNERDGGTVYNTLLYFGPDGSLLGKHRKLVATGGERLVWGSGDGSTLTVIDTPFGRIGGLICWENYMPLARDRHVRAGHRRAPVAHVGQLRRVAVVDAAHRQGGALLRGRHHVVPARVRRAGRASGP